MPCVRAIVAAPGGKMLYGQAWFYTAINSIVLGPPVYGIVAKWLVHDRTCNAGPVLCALHIFGRVVCLLFLHSFGYWYASWIDLPRRPDKIKTSARKQACTRASRHVIIHTDMGAKIWTGTRI